MSDRRANRYLFFLGALVACLQLEVPGAVRIGLARCEADSLPPPELVARCTDEAWWIGERIAELGPACNDAILAAMADPDLSSRECAANAFVWNVEAVGPLCTEPLQVPHGSGPGWTLARAHRHPLPWARPATTRTGYERREWIAVLVRARAACGDTPERRASAASLLFVRLHYLEAPPPEVEAVSVLFEPRLLEPAKARIQVVRTLAELGPWIEPRLHAALEPDRPLPVRLTATWALGHRGGIPLSGERTLLEAARAEDGELCADALAAMGVHGPPVRPALVAYLAGLVERAAPRDVAAMRALGGIGPGAAAAVPVVRAAFDDSARQDYDRVVAGATLWRLGVPVAELLPLARLLAARETGWMPVHARRLLHYLETDGDESGVRHYREIVDR